MKKLRRPTLRENGCESQSSIALRISPCRPRSYPAVAYAISRVILPCLANVCAEATACLLLKLARVCDHGPALSRSRFAVRVCGNIHLVRILLSKSLSHVFMIMFHQPGNRQSRRHERYSASRLQPPSAPSVRRQMP